MSTWLSLHYHLIFSTKHREPWVGVDIRPKLHEYLGGTVHGLGGASHGIGGTADHVHLLFSLKATHRLADFVRELKKASSAWVKDTCRLPGFSWQDGYYALTVSPSARAAVHDYITRQEEHHAKRTFQEELMELLEKAGIPYDPKYLG